MRAGYGTLDIQLHAHVHGMCTSCICSGTTSSTSTRASCAARAASGVERMAAAQGSRSQGSSPGAARAALWAIRTPRRRVIRSGEMRQRRRRRRRTSRRFRRAWSCSTVRGCSQRATAAAGGPRLRLMRPGSSGRSHCASAPRARAPAAFCVRPRPMPPTPPTPSGPAVAARHFRAAACLGCRRVEYKHTHMHPHTHTHTHTRSTCLPNAPQVQE
jgi:hypothetical protein